jgi:hypothetical protein
VFDLYKLYLGPVHLLQAILLVNWQRGHTTMLYSPATPMKLANNEILCRVEQTAGGVLPVMAAFFIT